MQKESGVLLSPYNISKSKHQRKHHQSLNFLYDLCQLCPFHNLFQKIIFFPYAHKNSFFLFKKKEFRSIYLSSGWKSNKNKTLGSHHPVGENWRKLKEDGTWSIILYNHFFLFILIPSCSFPDPTCKENIFPFHFSLIWCPSKCSKKKKRR